MGVQASEGQGRAGSEGPKAQAFFKEVERRGSGSSKACAAHGAGSSNRCAAEGGAGSGNRCAAEGGLQRQQVRCCTHLLLGVQTVDGAVPN